MKQLAFVLLLAAASCKSEAPDPNDRANGLYLQATSSYLQGKFDEALKALDESKTLNPGDPRLSATYGEIYLSQGKLEQALAQFDEATRRDPRRATNWSRKGYIEAQLGRQEQAEASVNKALELNPKDFNALAQLGELELHKDQVDDGVRHLAAAADTAPSLNKEVLYLQAVEALVKRDRAPEGALLLKNAAARGAQLSGPVYMRLGELLVMESDFTGARAAYESAAKVSPKDPEPWEMVGELAVHQGDDAVAEKAFKSSLAVLDRAVIHVQLARIALRRHDEKGANDELGKALATATGEERRESTELADLLVALKRPDDAAKLISTLAAEPENAKDVDLQLRAARLAQTTSDKAALAAACKRALASGAKKCP